MALHNVWSAWFAILVAATVQAQSLVMIEVKPAASSSLESRRLRVLPNGDLAARSINAASLIDFAYDVPTNPSERLSILPEWVYTQRYNITAKAPGKTDISSSEAISGKRVKDEFRQILRERFHLLIRTEEKTMPAYALVVAPSGAKMRQADRADCIYDTAQPGCHNFPIGFGHPLNGNAVTMEDLAHYIENWTDLPVVNKTGLDGFFATNSDGWLPMRLPPPPPYGAGNVDFSHLQTIDAALKGLGLTLKKESAVLPVYTVERLEQPSIHR